MRYHSDDIMQAEINDLAEMIRDCPEDKWARWVIRLLKRLDSYSESDKPDFLYEIRDALAMRLEKNKWP